MSDPTVIGKYQVLRRLGGGGMGSVFEVEHQFIKKRFALKLINADLAQDAEFKARALRESQASAAIHHENIVDVSDYGETEDGAPYIVMEFLEGEPLTALIEREAPLPVPRALGLALEILRGLEAAHAAGIVHRDIKPDNVFLLRPRPGEEPRVKIVDFGISKFQAAPDGTGLTGTQTVMGTPKYMSIEQCHGSRDVDGRADLFSVGVILFQMLSGQLPYTGDTFAAIVVNMVQEGGRDLTEVAPQVPVEVVKVVRRATALHREGRYATATEMREAIEEVLVSYGRRETLAYGSPPLPPGQRRKLTAQTARVAPGERPVGTTEAETVEQRHHQPTVPGTAAVAAQAGIGPRPAGTRWRLAAAVGGVALLAAGGAWWATRPAAPERRPAAPAEETVPAPDAAAPAASRDAAAPAASRDAATPAASRDAGPAPDARAGSDPPRDPHAPGTGEGMGFTKRLRPKVPF